MTDSIELIARNPEQHGFRWGYAPVRANGRGDKGTVVNDKAPHVIHVDDELMRKTFGGAYFVNAANGESPKVSAQRITRTQGIAGNKDDFDLKCRIVRSMFGQRNKSATIVEVEKMVYVAVDGTRFDSLEELQDYSSTLA